MIPNPKIGIVMPSYMGDYPNCATDKPGKFKRAVESVISQTYKNWMLIIIADGCDETVTEYRKYFSAVPNIACKRIPKQPMYSGRMRQAGVDIVKSETDLICYLDSDDMFGETHLEEIASRFDWDCDFCFYNDLHYNVNSHIFSERQVSMQNGCIGTSSLIHKSNLEQAIWEDKVTGSGEDWRFLEKMIRAGYKHRKIETCKYMVCHQATWNY